jgi:D-tyrosyl-tRNA(Tyr) deacylase
MKAVVQRVKWAKVVVDGAVVGEIGPGCLTLLGVERGDDEKKLEWMIGKILKLRIFEDSAGKMNLSLGDIKGGHLIVSQFTLLADVEKGNRPSFGGAAPPDEAEPTYRRALEMSRAMGEPLGVRTEGGRFQAHMEVSLLNDGPVTMIIEA